MKSRSSFARLPSLSLRPNKPIAKPARPLPASQLSSCLPSASLHRHSLTHNEHTYVLPSVRRRIPSIAEQLLPPTAAFRKVLRVPRLKRRFENIEDVLTRIPCEDFISSLLDRKPFTGDLLVLNRAKLRKHTSSQEILTECSDEETDVD